MLRRPPGPRALPFVGNLPRMFLNPMTFLAGLSERYGDVATLKLGLRSAVFVNHPALLETLLHDRHCPRSDESRDALRSFLGDGLLCIEGAHHLKHRRLMAPAFRRERIRAYGRQMCADACEEVASWRPGERRNLHEDMIRLTFLVVSRALFSANTRDDADEVAEALAEVMPWVMMGAVVAGVLPGLPVYYPKKARRSIVRLHEVVRSIVVRRRQEGGDKGDLLSMLLATRDADGGFLSDEDICSEALTLLLAGHDTAAATLTWAWYFLTQNLSIQDRVGQQVQRVLGTRPISVDDLDKLPLVEQVINETLRLYPVVWVGDRVPQRDLELGGYRIAAGTRVIFSPYVTQRDARFFPDPERFDPGRFSPEAGGTIPAGAYFPFGSGVHMCIGNNFALMETRIVLAAMAQRFAITAVKSRAPTPGTGIVMNAMGGWPVMLQAREVRKTRFTHPSAAAAPL